MARRAEKYPPISGAQPSHLQKALSACGGAITTSLVVTPFDVVKTRQQLWEAPSLAGMGSSGAGAEITAGTMGECCVELSRKAGSARPLSMLLCSQCSHYEQFTGGLSEALRPKPSFWRPPHPSLAGYPLSTPEMVVAIARHEGLHRLWSGLRPALAMSLPSTVLYMIAYDDLRVRLQRSDNLVLSAWAPLMAGMSARSLAAATVAPIELIRTQMQSGRWDTNAGIIAGMRRTTQMHGVGGLYRGLAPTLLRDIPFSGLYWMLYESNKRRAEALELSPFAASFASGASSGMVAASVTTPFDVVKTRMQIAIYTYNPASGKPPPPGPMETARRILQSEGPGAFAAGMSARVVKVAPACAIMISSYELGKRFFASAPGSGT